MSSLNKGYSPHSVFYYWKTLLICGAIKAVQLFCWVYELPVGGPVTSILFEQSPRLIFVIFGLFLGKYPGNGIFVVYVFTRFILFDWSFYNSWRLYFSFLWIPRFEVEYASFLLFLLVVPDSIASLLDNGIVSFIR